MMAHADTSPLEPVERLELLRLAREAVGATALVHPLPSFSLTSTALCAPGAVFVSIHRGDELRGCVGSIAAEKSLRQAVVDMACAAASRDPRFPAIEPRELSLLRVEISRLSRFRRARRTEVDPGHHGVYVFHPSGCGLLLPQVAARMRWGRERLLAEVCKKAGLDCGEWRNPSTELYVFTAEVFGEETA
jgi:AmmeMemoRadiSam system protein A